MVLVWDRPSVAVTSLAQRQNYITRYLPPSSSQPRPSGPPPAAKTSERTEALRWPKFSPRDFLLKLQRRRLSETVRVRDRQRRRPRPRDEIQTERRTRNAERDEHRRTPNDNRATTGGTEKTQTETRNRKRHKLRQETEKDTNWDNKQKKTQTDNKMLTVYVPANHKMCPCHMNCIILFRLPVMPAWNHWMFFNTTSGCFTVKFEASVWNQ